MTGRELFDAMGQIDEEYVQEATELPQRKPFPMFRLAGIAACLCLLLVGFLLWPQIQKNEQAVAVPGGIQPAENPPEAMEGDENMEPEETQELPDTGDRPLNTSLTRPTESQCPAEAMEPGDRNYPREDPSVILKVLSWDEEQMLAAVYEAVDSASIPVGTLLTVIFSERSYGDIAADGANAPEFQRKPQMEDFPTGSLMKVWYYGYEAGCIYVNAVEAVNGKE